MEKYFFDFFLTQTMNSKGHVLRRQKIRYLTSTRKRKFEKTAQHWRHNGRSWYLQLRLQLQRTKRPLNPSDAKKSRKQRENGLKTLV